MNFHSGRRFVVRFSAFIASLFYILFSIHEVGFKGQRADSQIISIAPKISQPVTVVTAYYNIPSKATHSKYVERIRNFLRYIPCHLYIFTDAESFQQLHQFRQALPSRTRWIITEFSDLPLAANMSIWQDQKKLDHESYHTPQLYVVWHQKTYFVQRAIGENAFHSEYFIWCDIGSFRTPVFLRSLATFPDSDRTESVLGIRKDQILLLLVRSFQQKDFELDEAGVPKQTFQGLLRIGAPIIAGHWIAWKRWSSVYYKTLDLLLQRRQFIGSDQNLMAVVSVIRPSLISFVKPHKYFQGRGDPFFFFHYYFSKLCTLNSSTAAIFKGRPVKFDGQLYFPVLQLL